MSAPNGPLGAGRRARLTVLRRAVTDYQGEWNVARAAHLYAGIFGRYQWRAIARRDLAQLCTEGLLALHDEPTNRHYSLATRPSTREDGQS
ncbi:hypothetical protein [Streptomyces sp. SGAir0957]